MSQDTSALRWDSVRRRALVVGCVFLGAAGVGAWFDVEAFLQAYLIAYTYWLGMALGSLALWMIHNLTGGAWGNTLRRNLEAASRTLPLLALLFVPLAVGARHIYGWADGHGEGSQRMLYLNVPFFLGRAGFYFVVWLALVLLLDRWSRAWDRNSDVSAAERMGTLSGPGLVLYGLTVTFAAVDWIMSLEAGWYSTIFGVIVASSQLLGAFALAVSVQAWLVERAGGMADQETWNDLGNLLLAFVMLWTYVSFSQFLLIWSGNLPEEITWYLAHGQGGWQVVAGLLALFYFAVPFLLLLSRDIKRQPRRLRLLAAALVIVGMAYQHWLIAPAFSPGVLFVRWLDPVLMVGLGGLWVAEFVRQLQARPLVFRPVATAESEVSHA